MRAQGGHALAGPSIPVTRSQFVAVEQPCDQIVISNSHQHTNRFNDFDRSTITLATAAARQPQLRVDTAGPVQREDNLPDRRVDIGNDLLQQGSDDAFLEAGVAGRIGPSRLQVPGEGSEVIRRS